MSTRTDTLMDTSSRWALRLVAPLVWRSRKKVARKLEGFAATEQGSALDMLKAAELTDEPRLRALFFRHALDESRHARLFREAARRIAPDGGARRGGEYALIHATRQNLYEKLGLVRFIAFVHLAERRGELQFRALRDHFAHHPHLCELEPLFARIGKDERFHVRYSGMLLDEWRAEGRRREVALALARVRLARAWSAWRRMGRILGDVTTRLLLSLVYLLVLPLFALAQRRADRRSSVTTSGWRTRALPTSLDDARRQS